MIKRRVERLFGTPSSKALEIKPPLTEQERLKAQMEQLRSRLAQVAQLISHPAFDRFKTSNDWGKGESYHWGISLRPVGNEMECATKDFLGFNQHYLTITNGLHGASLSLSMDHHKTGMDYIESSPLKDPITGETISDIRLDFDTQVSDVHWLIRALFGGPEFTYQQITLEEKTRALDNSFPSHYSFLGIDPISTRHYMREFSARPNKKRQVTFETRTNRRITNEPSPHLERYGFPDDQYFPLEVQECVPRVDALIGFIMPALIREIQNYGPTTLPQSSFRIRRIGN